MKILIKAARILDKKSPFHNQVKNILLQDGIIKSISDKSSSADKVIESPSLTVSPGWFDMRVSVKDPGYEYKEDVITACNAAAAGGFTEFACLPNTKPAIHSKDVISYIKSKCRDNLVGIYPVASVTLGSKGEELTEMIDLHHSGAIAFSDGENPVWHSDVFLRSLLYLQTFEGLLINHAEDRLLTHSGQMNEGFTATRLGLKGIPKLAEELMVERDLRLLEYAGGKLHFAHISSPGSLELIKAARKKGLTVTCDIAAYQLALDDTLMESFDTHLKVNPPLRSKKDIELFWKALMDDTIDVIVSDHNPQDEESKNLEFDLADFGMAGLETAFAVINTFNKKIPLEKIIEKISVRPREIMKIEIPSIREGEQANLTAFDPEIEWTFTEKDIRSRSKNNPFLGKKLKGKALAVFNKNKYSINTV